LRGLAALMVVLSHACGYIPAIFYHFPDELRVAIMHNGYHGVFVFFTISGVLFRKSGRSVT
jgi:peptidoglycan/LPS O-acetylase OafA/YrhL